jgi:hypothetical protein
VARRVDRVTITAAGRDRGKIFELKEMPADQGERWANRAMLAFANAGGKLPEGALEGGMAGLDLSWRNVLVVGLLAFKGLSYREIEPLLDEMKPFISWCPPGNAPPQPIFPGEDSQIEEVATWYTLRYELLQLHLGFSLAGALSTTGTTPEATPA